MTAAGAQASIGVDIGGTSTKAAVIDADGNVLLSNSLPTRHGPEGVTTTAIDAIDSVLAAGELHIDLIGAIGVGIPGAVDPIAGTVRHAVNVGIGSEPVPLASQLSRRFGRLAHIENDVRAATLGAEVVLEATVGPIADLVYLSVGTGIAAGFVAGGRLRRGASLVAGEIGHIPIDPAGPLCACGQTGCIEAIASGAAIERAWPVTSGSPSRSLFEAATRGDQTALAVWDSVIGGLSRAVLLLTLTFDPTVIALGGGVAELGDDLRDAIVGRLVRDQRESDFLSSLAIDQRMHVIDPAALLGPIGAVRAALASLQVG